MTYKHLTKWTSKDPATGTQNYLGTDCSNYYIVYTKTRDSDILAESNYAGILADLNTKFDNHESIQVLSFNHWACGYYDQIAIDSDLATKDILDYAEKILNDLDRYPVFDDEDYSNRRCEQAGLDLEELKKDIENECEYTKEFKNLTDEQLYDYCLDRVY